MEVVSKVLQIGHFDWKEKSKYLISSGIDFSHSFEMTLK